MPPSVPTPRESSLPRPTGCKRRRCAGPLGVRSQALVVAALWVGAAATAQGGAPDPALAPLRGLAGQWAMHDQAAHPLDAMARYRVMGAGSVVVETLFVGMAEETVTSYYVEGGHLAATQHSLRAGPSRLRRPDGGGRRVFRFINDKATAGQARAITLTLLDDDRLQLGWAVARQGEQPLERTFELHRELEVARLSAEVARLRSSLETLQEELDRRMRREIRVRGKGRQKQVFSERRTIPPGPGWEMSGVPTRTYLHDQVVPFASTFAGEGDKGMTVGHYGFKAGPGCRLRFAVIGGHGYVAVVRETKAPPRRIKDIRAFSEDVLAGEFGPVVERIVGGHWKVPRAVVWDLARFEGQRLRLYLVDAETNHYGQVGISEVAIVERLEDK